MRGKGETVRQERTASLATDRHGKPHLEQDRIGGPWRGPRRPRVGCSSRTATCGLEEWLPNDRTRLIGRLHWLLRNVLFRCARQGRGETGRFRFGRRPRAAIPGCTFHGEHVWGGAVCATEKPDGAGRLRGARWRGGARPSARVSDRVRAAVAIAAAGCSGKAFARPFKNLAITSPKCFKCGCEPGHKRSRFALVLTRIFLDSPILATYCGPRWFFVVDRGSCFRVRRR